MQNQKSPFNDHFIQRVLDRIEGEHVTPRPHWEFIFKNYFFWTLGAFAVVLGAFAFSAALFRIENVGWRLYAAIRPDFFGFFLSVAPFLWILALAIFVLIGYLNIRHTKTGYRYPLGLIAAGAVLTSIVLGTFLYAMGFGGFIEGFVGDHPPFYQPIMLEEQSWWVDPTNGLLAGEIMSAASNDTSFVVRDFSGKEWVVDGMDLRGPDLAAVARGGTVRIVGAPTTATSSTFHACFVFPWETRGEFENTSPPPPLTTISSTTERNTEASRSEICKDIRPYQQLRDIDEKDSF